MAGRAADSTLAGIAATRATDHNRTDPQTAHACAALLARQPALAPGLFAVALLHSGHRLGWPAAWRDEILRLCQHEVADARNAALAVTLVTE